MMAKTWRWFTAIGLMVGLLGAGTGCQPASTTPSGKTAPQPEKKDKSVTPPKPDVG